MRTLGRRGKLNGIAAPAPAARKLERLRTGEQHRINWPHHHYSYMD
jgi:hypothetical protein